MAGRSPTLVRTRTRAARVSAPNWWPNRLFRMCCWSLMAQRSAWCSIAAKCSQRSIRAMHLWRCTDPGIARNARGTRSFASHSRTASLKADTKTSSPDGLRVRPVGKSGEDRSDCWSWATGQCSSLMMVGKRCGELVTKGKDKNVMKKDYEKYENNEINENFRLFRSFRFFRNPSSFHY